MSKKLDQAIEVNRIKVEIRELNKKINDPNYNDKWDNWKYLCNIRYGLYQELDYITMGD